MLVVLCERSSEVAKYLRDALKEYEQILYLATDRMELYGKPNPLTEDGSVVHVLALRGLIELLMEHLSSRGSEVDDSLTSHLSSLIQSWNAYVEEFRTETSSQLGENYEMLVQACYEPPWDSECLCEPEDFDFFVVQRDSIECFLVGADIEWPAKDFRGPLIEPDRKLKDLVKTIVVPHMQKEYPPSVVMSWNVEWLPESFWWRHL